MNIQLNLLAVPDEALLMILKELSMVDVLYSIADVNRRLGRLAHDSLYIRHLDLTGLPTVTSRWNQLFPTDQHVMSRMCDQILPRIHDQVHQLTVEPYSINAILAAVHYPQLYSLSLRNFPDDVLHHCLTGDVNLQNLLSKQITHLHIDVCTTSEVNSKIVSSTFELILSLCERLTELDLSEGFLRRGRREPNVFLINNSNFLSSTLTKLKINVATHFDCLLLLDGRLDSLSTLTINVADIFDPVEDIGHNRELPRLKCFSFTSFRLTDDFDTLIVRLLRRMVNLEELKLHLSVLEYNGSYVDGVQLSDDVLNHLPQLQKFSFCIQTKARNDESDLPLLTNEAIQRSFIGRGYQQVFAFVRTDADGINGECQIYSLPYDFEYFLGLDNSFPGGVFRKVRFLTMDDEHPFEDALFRIISRDMPFLEHLEISNKRPQKHKQRSSPVLVLPHLKLLDLEYAHDDYADLFLLKRNTCLPRLSTLRIAQRSIRRLTNDFNSDSGHFNFHGVKNLDFSSSLVCDGHFVKYFPLSSIIWTK